jgi:flagellar motility protein MotE (MotC chaperone)
MKLMGHSSDSIYRSNRHYYLYIYLSNRESWKQLDVSKENIKTIKKILRQPEKKIEKEKKAREKEAEKIAAKNLRKDIFEY